MFRHEKYKLNLYAFPNFSGFTYLDLQKHVENFNCFSTDACVITQPASAWIYPYLKGSPQGTRIALRQGT